MACTNARSSGGKIRLSAASGLIFDAEIAGPPPPPPALHLPRRQADHLCRVFVAEAWSFVQQQDEPKALHLLNRRGAATHRC
jgi:hypothetical protein